jgi:hypothetical protein
MKIAIFTDIPDELAKPLLQHIRDFDTAHPGVCKFQIIANAPNKSTKEIVQELDIKPPLKIRIQGP